MKSNLLAVVAAIVGLAFVACDDTTDNIGTSITDTNDLLNVATNSFIVKSQSVEAGNLYARNTTGYVGKVKDPETGTYVTGNFMTQFHTFEDYAFPDRDSLIYVQGTDTIMGTAGKIEADSCSLGLYYTEFYGDSLATMTLTMHELAEPMQEGVKYYTNDSPETLGLLRSDGIHKNKTYTLTDLSVSEDDRNDDSYMASIFLKLNDPYTDKDGRTYTNYGTYIMTKYYEHPEYFKNSYAFTKNVCPGFYFKNKAGLGSMAYITVSQMNVYFKYCAKSSSTKRDTVYVGVANFAGTEEVLQSTNIENEETQDLLSDQSCTYVKSPAGYFTELELPVDDILKGHDNDTLNTAKIVLTKVRNTTDSEYAFDEPTTLLLLPKDSLTTFFENDKLPDYKTSYIARNSSSTSADYGTYTFNNISGLITRMAALKQEGLAKSATWTTEHPDWNKVLVVPVSATYVTQSSVQVLVKVVHDMALSSVKLVKGTDSGEIKVDVIYSKFKKE